MFVYFNRRWNGVETADLVKLIFAGTVRARTRAEANTRRLQGPALPAGRGKPLQRVLGREHFDQLSDELLRKIGDLYRGSREGLTIDRLERRVRDLSRWQFSNHHGYLFSLRAEWASAWLAELQGNDAVAERRYARFLKRVSSFAKGKSAPWALASSDGARRATEDGQSPIDDLQVLKLLAGHNRAVIQLRSGNIAGLRPLVESAIAQQLPGACLSLYNLIGVALRSSLWALVAPQLCQDLADLIQRMPKLAQRWFPGVNFEPPPPPEEVDAAFVVVAPPEPPPAGPPDSAAAQAEAQAQAEEEEQRRAARIAEVVPEILEDSQSRDAFLRQLIRVAAEIATDRTDDYQIWSEQTLELETPPPVAGARGEERWSMHARYAEAVSLLYPRDISVTMLQAGPAPLQHRSLAGRLQRRVRQAIARDDLVAAASQLHKLRVLVAALDDDERQAGQAEADKLAERLQRAENRRKRRDLRDKWREMETEVAGLCRLENLAELNQRAALLAKRQAELQQAYEQAAHRGVVAHDVVAAFERDLEERRRELRGRTQTLENEEALQAIVDALPLDDRTAVPPELFHALEVQHKTVGQGDPRWSSLQRHCRAHNARYHFGQALRLLTSGPIDQAEVLRQLTSAVNYDRELSVACAPLIALIYLPGTESYHQPLGEIRATLLQHARQVVGTVQRWLDESELGRAEVRARLLAEMVTVLRRLLELVLNSEREAASVDASADGVSGRPGPLTEVAVRVVQWIFESAGTAELAGMQDVVRDWKHLCQGWYDPRHPYHDLQRSLEVAQALAEAHELVQAEANDDGRSFDAPAGELPQVKSLVGRALDLGLATPNQVERAAWAYAMAYPLPGDRAQRAAALASVLAQAQAYCVPLNGEAAEQLIPLTQETLESWIVAALPPPAPSPEVGDPAPPLD